MNIKMMFISICILFLVFSCKDQGSATIWTNPKDAVDYVNPLIGTKKWSKKLQIAGPENPAGHTYPVVGPPFAMTKWCAQTAEGNVPYWYDDNKIQGFRATHHPVGSAECAADYGSITIMPLTGNLVTDPEKRASVFSHVSEKAKPHYYSVMLNDYNIKAEMTATSLAGFLHFTFPESQQSYIVIDFFTEGGLFEMIPGNQAIKGKILAKGNGTPDDFSGYFYVLFDKPFEHASIIVDSTDSNKHSCLYVKYKTSKDEVIQVKAGISFVSEQQAMLNLQKDIPHWDFNKLSEKIKKEWNNELQKINVDGVDDKRKTIFYTALYHALLMPREFSEHGVYRSPYDGKVHKGVCYTDFSLWDTFRALHPLFIFLVPDRVNEMIQAFLNAYDEGGWIPKWPNPGYYNMMMGTHADAVIADAYVKGIRGYEARKAFEAMEKHANVASDGLFQARVGINYFKELGYVPADVIDESIARTMEFAYDDYCLAKMAGAMNNKNAYDKYITRAGYYKNTLDDSTKLVRGKKSDGSWVDANAKWVSFWAGNTDFTLAVYKWNYTWFAPHDISWLINFMGGESQFIKGLDHFFEQEYYYIGDEFSMHAPFLYNYAGQPWKTQKLMKELLSFYFTDEPDGLSGNDDCGQMSAWYIFSAMGLYPVCPGDAYYTISGPVFKNISMALPNGKVFRVMAEKLSDENIYIESATLNGKEYNKSFIMHDDIMKGGTLVLNMSSAPSAWGVELKNRPVSAIPDKKLLQVPYLKNGLLSFYDSTLITLDSYIFGATIYYSLNGEEPTDKSQKYTSPVSIHSSCIMKARIYKDGFSPSPVISFSINKIPRWKVTLNTKFDTQFDAGGDSALIDKHFGNLVYNSGQWQGYKGVDLNATIDMGREHQVRTISTRYLRNLAQRAFFPDEVIYYISLDGKQFKEVGKFKYDNTKEPISKVHQVKEFTINIDERTRFIKVIAVNPGKCPEWFGKSRKLRKPMLFIDEIVIDSD